MARSRGQAKVHRTGEVVQDRTPGGVLLGAAAVALVHDHEIEEVRAEQREQCGVRGGARERLVAGEVDLAAGVHAAAHPVQHIAAERRGEILQHRLPQQLVPVREVQDAVVAVRVEGRLVGAQLGHHLHRGERLARARRHEEEHATPAPGDRRQHAVDGHHLVVAGSEDVSGDGRATPVERFGEKVRAVVVEAVHGLVLGPRGRWRGEGLHPALGPEAEVVLDGLPAIRGVGEGNVELLGVAQGLLHPVCRGTIRTLRLDDGDRGSRCGLQYVVHGTGTEFARDGAEREDPLGAYRVLLDDLVRVPARCAQHGHHRVTAGVPLEGAGAVGRHVPNLADRLRQQRPHRHGP